MILVHKPYGVLTQFTDGSGRPTLAGLVPVKGVYPAGRLDQDSEGLVVLTDDGGLQHRLSHPRFGKTKGYWVQVERVPDDAALQRLIDGVMLRDGPARAVSVVRIEEPPVGPRDPPVRSRLSVPTQWLDLVIDEGRNRQVRRMTGAIGHGTLRLVRYRVGPYRIDGLAAGAWRAVS